MLLNIKIHIKGRTFWWLSTLLHFSSILFIALRAHTGILSFSMNVVFISRRALAPATCVSLWKEATEPYGFCLLASLCPSKVKGHV